MKEAEIINNYLFIALSEESCHAIPPTSAARRRWRGQAMDRGARRTGFPLLATDDSTNRLDKVGEKTTAVNMATYFASDATNATTRRDEKTKEEKRRARQIIIIKKKKKQQKKKEHNENKKKNNNNNNNNEKNNKLKKKEQEEA